MEREERLRRYALRGSYGERSEAPLGVPGQQSSSSQLPAGSNGPYAGSSLQLKTAHGGLDTTQAHETAARGMSGTGTTLPHLDAIQRSFGKHDVSGVRAHVGGAASEAAGALGAHGYASGDQVAFASSPDLRLAAHEAAHVVQQRGGVRLSDGIGREGDAYEQHADAVADLVVRGESAESLLDTMAHRGSAGGSAVQFWPNPSAGDREPSTTPVGVAGVDGYATEGHFRVGHLPIIDDRPPALSPIQLGSYVILSEMSFDVMIDYRIGRRSDSSEPATGPAATTEAHVGIGGAPGHGEHGVGAGVQAEITGQLADLGNSANLEWNVGGDISLSEGSFGVGLSGGTMRFGDSLTVPLPSVTLNLVEWERGETPHPLVVVINVPIPHGFATRFVLGGGMVAEVRLQGMFVVKFEPNWPNVIRRVTEWIARQAATTATEATTATTAEAATGAEAITAAEAAAAGDAVGTTGADAAIALGELGGMVAAPLLAGAALATIFVYEVGSAEELRARARGTAHTVFTYCMAYTMTWFGDASAVSGPGAAEGAAAARRDIETQQARNPDVLSQVRAGRMAAAQELYTACFDIISPRAEESLMRSTDSDEGSLDAMVIHDRISQVRWNGPLFLEFGA